MMDPLVENRLFRVTLGSEEDTVFFTPLECDPMVACEGLVDVSSDQTNHQRMLQGGAHASLKLFPGSVCDG